MEGNQKQVITVDEALVRALSILEGVSVPVGVLQVLSPEGMNAVMRQVVLPIADAKGYIGMVQDYLRSQEAAKQATAAQEDGGTEEGPRLELVPDDDGAEDGPCAETAQENT